MRSHCDTLLFLNEKTTIPFGVTLSCPSAAPSSPTGSSPVPRPRAPALSRLEDERVQSSPVLVPIATSVPGTRLRAGRALRSRRSRGPVPPRCAAPGPPRGAASPGRKPNGIGFWPFVFLPRGRRPPAPRSRMSPARPALRRHRSPGVPRTTSQASGRSPAARSAVPTRPARGEARFVPARWAWAWAWARAAAAQGSAGQRGAANPLAAPPTRPAPPPRRGLSRPRPRARGPFKALRAARRLVPGRAP